ncbi:hypothetical protein [Microbacterium sp. NIBRBAC000506063]|uniref:hypothetical protein n=1 Tax=Microbacterium sp. NIBRBAC000506063 TaxID=2734618 RepID=UPI001BB771C8|nr:hypothetical protein [Microbacterium sp. NIBRBAC000506063]QTV79125.1 hypothetical protein KAE78_08445 [Microbacterium sp. NIBRBAC000506063]
MSSWIPIAAAIALGALAAVITAIIRQGKRSDPPGDASVVVRVTLVVAAIWAGFSLVGGIVTGLVILLQSQVLITVPVREFWPALPEGTMIEGTNATLVSGGFTSAEILVEGLSAGARVSWMISQTLLWLLPAVIAAMIAVACFQLLAGRAFAPVVARMLMVTAAVVAAGGVAATMLGDLAGSMASAELFAWNGAQYPDIPGVEDALQAWWPSPAFTLTLPFWPLAAGLAFAALAAVFRYGARLQRDTEGLV